MAGLFIEFLAGVSYTGSEIINVHKTKEQTEHNKTLFPNPNQNNNGSFVLRHLSPVHESLPEFLVEKCAGCQSWKSDFGCIVFVFHLAGCGVEKSLKRLWPYLHDSFQELHLEW